MCVCAFESYMYIYIYIYIEREGERDRERDYFKSSNHQWLIGYNRGIIIKIMQWKGGNILNNLFLTDFSIAA